MPWRPKASVAPRTISTFSLDIVCSGGPAASRASPSLANMCHQMILAVTRLDRLPQRHVEGRTAIAAVAAHAHRHNPGIAAEIANVENLGAVVGPRTSSLIH